MSDTVELLELVHDYLKKLGHSDSFENIWNNIVNNHNLIVHGDSKEEIIADLYTELVLDNRFVLTNEGLWALREFLKYEDIKKQYDYIDQFETTEEFGNIDLDSEDDSLTSTLVIDKMSLDEDFDEQDIEEDTEENHFADVEYEDDLKIESAVKYNNSFISEAIGITEEIDWKAVELELSENN